MRFLPIFIEIDIDKFINEVQKISSFFPQWLNIPQSIQIALAILLIIVFFILQKYWGGYFTRKGTQAAENGSSNTATQSPNSSILAGLFLLLVLIGFLFITVVIVCSAFFGDGNGETNVPTDSPTVSTTEHSHDWADATRTSPKTCRTCGAQEGSRIYVKGEIFSMGTFEQDGDTQSSEPIKWRVLKYDADMSRALVISEYCLDAIPFDKNGDADWENSSLREWLNNDFIKCSFSEDESKRIVSVTADLIFELSFDEAVEYFGSDTDRSAKATAYCFQRGCFDPKKYAIAHDRTPDNKTIGCTWWWLRSKGKDSKHAGNVVAAGTPSKYGAYKNSKEGAIRPAMWVSMG